MHQELRTLDLNLLRVFDAIYRHRRVNLAAGELAISPSALSHALSRLRASVDDALFIRQGSNMQPTARAHAIAPGIARALSTLAESLRAADEFSPETSTQTFRFAVTDYTAAIFFPDLITRLQHSAPGVSVKTFYSTGYDSFADLINGKVDFAIGFQAPEARHQGQIGSIACFNDNYVVAVSSSHPRIRDGLTLAQFLAEGHVVVNPWNEASGTVDRALAGMHLRRRTVVELPSLLSAPAIVAGSELIITLPEKAITTLFRTAPLRCFPVPFPLDPYTLSAWFCSEHSGTPGHEWMRGVIDGMRVSGDGVAE